MKLLTIDLVERREFLSKYLQEAASKKQSASDDARKWAIEEIVVNGILEFLAKEEQAQFDAERAAKAEASSPSTPSNVIPMTATSTLTQEAASG